MNKNIRRIIGILFWCGLAVSAYVFSKPIRDSKVIGASNVFGMVSQTEKLVTFADPVQRLRPMDPVFLYSSETDSWHQVGYVQQCLKESKELQINWYAVDTDIQNCQLFQHFDSGDLQTVISTLFPQEKQERIKQQITKAVAAHGRDLGKAFEPLIRRSLQESLPIVEQEFRIAVRRHRSEVDKLATQWNREIVEKRLIPLAKKELLPIVRRHGEPVAEKIGRKIWDRASLFSFGWRAIYDKSPLPQKNLLQKEWERFLETDAIPIFEAHTKDIVMAVQATVRDVTKNRAVRAELSRVADDLVEDPKARSLVRTLLKETLLENDRLKKALRGVWSSDEAHAAMNMAGERLEPIVRKIGDEIFGTEETGIDPGFARVLRSQILRKDQRWIVAYDVGVKSEPTIPLAKKPMPFPVVYLADEEE